ncbi:hypothetical protein MKW94_010672 [Papaver nudicaule]|uniref:Uncharacterized protein n=1 Tax=Papaver nudicaule TaxID=74823 RepID=A0AA41W276_PAPNU|nr:hypothetical protein [Papaver nudicaule]
MSSIDEVKKESAGETLGGLIQLDKRLRRGYESSHQEQLSVNLDFIKSLKKMDMSGEIETTNKETHELPTEFFEAAFGKSMKSSGCYFKHESATIREAVEASHELYYCFNGQTVLDIGCGQGGLVLYIAQKYKNCEVTGLTNSKAQVNYLLSQAEQLGLTNVHAGLADVNQYEFGTYDRLLMIKLIEVYRITHEKHTTVFKKLSTWMTEDSLLFVEHVCHKTFSHSFEAIDEDDWYSGFIFPKGSVTILAANSLLYFQDDVSVVDHWVVNGMHMARSFDAWRKKLDKNTEVAKEILLSGLGGSHEALNGVATHIRTFCIGGYEQFSFNNGDEWMLAHLLFKKK